MDINKVGSWNDLSWNQIEAKVFRMQRRVFDLSLNGNRTKMHKLQLKLTSCAEARLLAVRKAAEDSKGKDTAGIDGIRSLTDIQKLKLAKDLHLQQIPRPVRRVFIEKPGSKEQRPLSIPTMSDRALQHLIVLAIEPEWEAKFSSHQYGFRKGRSAHDAVGNIRKFIQRKPCWVLDADIEKFFDRVDQEVLLAKLQTHPRLGRAIQRVLKSGVMNGVIIEPTESGTPQGGPLSPVLANVVLSGLEQDLLRRFHKGAVFNGQKIRGDPRIVIYADDMAIFHPEQHGIEAMRHYVDEWLGYMGLNLSPTKTRIVHTLKKTKGTAGFDFLGFRMQQFKAGKYALKPYFNQVLTLIKPSNESMKRLYAKVADIIDSRHINKRLRPVYDEQAAKGKANSPEIMIYQLNRVLNGWANYYCFANSKRTFSTLDHRIFQKLWRWVRRNRPKDTCGKRIHDFFSDGDPWRFSVKTTNGTVATMMRLDAKPIKRHILIQASRSYYDGDLVYWATRMGHYPGLPGRAARLLKRQYGKCVHCRKKFHQEDRWLISPTGKHRRLELVHRECKPRSDEPSEEDGVACSPVLGN